MKKLTLCAILALAGCDKPGPGPGPGPVPPPKVMEFVIETPGDDGVKIEGKLKPGTNLTADEAKNKLGIAADLLKE